MEILKKLDDLTKPISQGPIPSFTKYNLIKAIEIIGEEQTIGRSTLSSKLKIGAGAVRTLILHLKKAGLIEIMKNGCQLTSKGDKIYKELKTRFPKKSIIEPQYSIGRYCFGILVRNAAEKVSLGIEQRDAAVREGAKGALTLIFKNGELYLPPAPDEKSKEWIIKSDIYRTFIPRENDVIIISYADSENDAEESARAAAWTLYL